MSLQFEVTGFGTQNRYSIDSYMDIFHTFSPLYGEPVLLTECTATPGSGGVRDNCYSRDCLARADIRPTSFQLLRKYTRHCRSDLMVTLRRR